MTLLCRKFMVMPPENLGKNISDLSFEEAIKRLNETVESLEKGNLKLSEATKLYEEGIILARVCTEQITAAEIRITQIRTTYGEQMRMYEDEGDESEEEMSEEES